MSITLVRKFGERSLKRTGGGAVMVSRRTVLSAVAVAAGASTLGGASRAFGAARMPLTVVNNTGRYPDSAIYLYIVGTNLATGQQSYVNRSGNLIPVSMDQNGPDGYADLSIPLASGGTTTISLPNMSGR